MDMINEQKSSDFDDFVDVVHTNDVKKVSEDGEAPDDSFSESPSDVSEDDLASDFAKQLKEHRKKVIHGVKEKEDFSQELRKHRETLVETWDHHEDGSETKSTVQAEEQNGQSAGVNDFTRAEPAPAVTVELDAYDFGDFAAPSMEVDDDDDFGDFDAAAPISEEQQPQTEEMADDCGEFVAPTAVAETPGTGNYAFDDWADDSTSEAQQSQPVDEIDDGLEVVHIENEVDALAGSPETAEPIEQQASAVDEFGGFGVAPSEPQNEEALTHESGTTSASESHQSLPLDQQEGVPADGVGEFGGAPAKPPIEVPTQDGEGDDFGDFVTTPVSEPQQEVQNDEFGGFEEAPLETLAEVPTQDGDGDDFSDLGAAIASEPQQEVPDDVIGGFEEVPSEPQAMASTQDGDGDEFGDFGAASASEPQQGCPDNEIGVDDFEDFGPASVSEPHQSQSIEKQEVADDDDFGDFGAAPTEHPPDSATQETALDDFGDFGEAQGSAAQPSQQEDGDDDDFGDFGAAPSGPEISISKEAESADDDFGDFGAVSAPVAQNDEDEDFGISGAPVVAGTRAETDDDDEFGDFGDAGTEPEPPEPSATDPLDGEDDDFGDFGAAPSALAGETKPSNGEDDEFGDFGESKAEPEADEDFGDFSDFNEADARAAQPPAPTPSHQDAPPLNTGPQFERAKLVFSKIQSKYAFDQIEIKDGNSSGDLMTLKSFIASLNYKDPAETEEANHIVLSTLKDSQNHKESHSKVIISQDGRGPYFHLIYPIGGPVAPIDKIGTDRVNKRGSVVVSNVPELLPIQLPTGNECAVDMASPTPEQPKKNAGKLSSMTGTGEKNGLRGVAPAKTSSSKEQSPSEAAKELLRKIPDLSFMLSTTLSLPKK